jgi:ATP-dependent helicase/nuclease subunit A
MNEMQHFATNPAASCCVIASAGTGKTWQLVARITRLLLGGAQLDSILAISFTRKAAAEMQERLNQRLREFMESDDAALNQLLQDIGATPDDSLRASARGLFESVVRSEHSLRATTFHSFCQDLLQRFPLEAGLPPGFELVEHTGVLIKECWDALYAEASRAPEQALGSALQQLFELLNGPANTRTALFRFIDHRSDWWAYTQGSNRPVSTAINRLEAALDIDTQTAHGNQLWNDQGRAQLREFLRLLALHANKTNTDHAGILARVLADSSDPETAVDAIRTVFLTDQDEPRKRKPSQTQCKSMGAAGEERFLQLHVLICEQLAQLREHRNRMRSLQTNSAWYLAGQRMLDHYQRIKRERRMLDFADLEWSAFQLLSHPEQAHWIQYKLDERIDHLLIDEFQDTNPTQWRLILPILEEMAAGGERARSLFIVGDAKQSIYRFRRGNPRLLGYAAAWMQQHLGARLLHLDASWRSSPLIMDTVNRLFQSAHMQDLLTDFQTHSTHKTERWGRLELWPLVEPEQTDGVDYDASQLRNPLQLPRNSLTDRRHYREGIAIATRINELVAAGTAVYDDILILLRSRTHLADYEAALQTARIPYISYDRGTLLDSIECRDLEALLSVLMTPQDNLSLAHVLRSPLLSASDEDLLLLAGEPSGSWFERLLALASTAPAKPVLERAATLLSQWHQLAGRIPIHDLLETIFHQGNLVKRYCAAFPAGQVPRVAANLTRFVELALEVDAGRYPTLPRFLAKLGQLRALDRDGPSQASPLDDSGQRVRILTIHAAKGLEAPIVFLADAAATGSGAKACQTLVSWPAEADRPTDFMLLNNSQARDSYSRDRYLAERGEEQREAANLLYVALTRARNMLVVSGCATSRQQGSAGNWHQQLSQALCGEASTTTVHVETYLEPAAREPTPASAVLPVDVDPRLCEPIITIPDRHAIAPSRQLSLPEAGDGDADGLLRGLVIHRLLQLSLENPYVKESDPDLLARVARERGLNPDDPRLQSWWQESCAVLTQPELGWLTKPAPDHRAYNEVPIAFRQGQRTVYGIIDRLLVGPERAWIIDYKTHRLDSQADVAPLAERYLHQLALYRQGVQQLWPEREVTCCLLLTHRAQLLVIG